MFKLFDLTSVELLTLHGQIAKELRNRGIVRSSNNPTGDLAEYLFCNAFHWKQESNSNAHIDATCRDGFRYQIKGRRVTGNKSRQLSAMRDFDGEHFDFLAAVIFSEDYIIIRAAIIPRSVVLKQAKFVQRTNSHTFFLRDDVWNFSDVRDVTSELRSVKL